jgi:glycerophosphoryl diester phosphodiesterase
MLSAIVEHVPGIYDGPVPNHPLVLAHRGANRRERENTIDAFEAAMALGADGVELDVRRTADGVLVVHHDPAIDGGALIVAQPFEALRAAAPWVPTLPEALAALDGAFVNIEVKCLPWEPDPDPDAVVMQGVAMLVEALGIRDRVVVSSFDLGALGSLRALNAHIAAGWLTHGQSIEQAAEFAQLRGVPWIHPDVATAAADPAATVRVARERGLRVDVWTVNDPAVAVALASAGVDALITDVPDQVLAAVRG